MCWSKIPQPYEPKGWEILPTTVSQIFPSYGTNPSFFPPPLILAFSHPPKVAEIDDLIEIWLPSTTSNACWPPHHHKSRRHLRFHGGKLCKKITMEMVRSWKGWYSAFYEHDLALLLIIISTLKVVSPRNIPTSLTPRFLPSAGWNISGSY